MGETMARSMRKVWRLGMELWSRGRPFGNYLIDGTRSIRGPKRANAPVFKDILFVCLIVGIT